jgi:SAM-dependent methyltransferase
MQKYYHYYEKSYEKFTPDWFDESNLPKINQFLTENSESLIKFVESYEQQFNWPRSIFQNKRILVSGCGFGGLCRYFEKRGAIVTGIDISQLAIIGAKEIAKLNQTSCEFIQADLVNLDNGIKLDKFDFIIDDHLLHCLTTKSDRENYLRTLISFCNEDGLLFCESMAFHSGLQVPVNYRFDENHILWKNLEGKNDLNEEIMTRKIATSVEIEDEIRLSGFQINYLYYHSELSFCAFTEYTDYPFQYLPKTIRLTAAPAKKSN